MVSLYEECTPGMSQCSHHALRLFEPNIDMKNEQFEIVVQIYMIKNTDASIVLVHVSNL